MSAENLTAWRLKSQRLELVGEVCPLCNGKIFPPRDVCPYCAETKQRDLIEENVYRFGQDNDVMILPLGLLVREELV